MEAIIPAAGTRNEFLAVYTFDNKFGAQAQQRTRSVGELDVL